MRIKTTLLGLAILTLVTGAEAKSPPLSASSGAAKANVLIMLDTSGSMGGTNIAIAKKGIKALVQDPELRQDVQFGLGVWASYAPGRMVVDLSPSGATRIPAELDKVLPCYGAGCQTYQRCYNRYRWVRQWYGGRLRWRYYPYRYCYNYGRNCSYRTGCGTNVAACMRSADRYLRSSVLPKSQGQSCLKTVVIVVSDGYWYGHSSALSTARRLNKDGVQTFVLGLRLPGLPAKPNCTKPIRHWGLRNYCELAEAGGTKDDSPVFANDTAGLVKELKYLIRRVLSSNFTGTAPVLQPGISSSDRILQSSYKALKDKQWKGYLRSFSLKDDGSVGKEQFESGSKLAGGRQPQAGRNIWTMCDGLVASKNNFTDKNLTALTACLSGVPVNPASPLKQTYTFTTLNGSNAAGPTSIAGYKGTSLDGLVTLSGGIQYWSVPVTGTYSIQAVGATGGNQGERSVTVGHPANMNGEFSLTAGDRLKILVGQHGFQGSTRPGWGGGGGSFVATAGDKPLIVAGGSGASHTQRGSRGLTVQNASLTPSGKNGSGGSRVTWADGQGATGGNGGDGAGFYGDGSVGNNAIYRAVAGQGPHTVPQAFIDGGAGDVVGGGFGGGGGVTNTWGGGGGGYSGGQGGYRSSPYAGGGGGSYNTGSNQNNYLDMNNEYSMGHGKVVLTIGGGSGGKVDYSKLIHFVRGTDLGDQDNDTNITEDRWKLGDIVDSAPILVGPPGGQISSESAHKSYRSEAYQRARRNYQRSFIDTNRCGRLCATRDEMIYVGGNDGMLHAFYAQGNNAGKERWAFIPPSMLRRLPEIYKTGQNKVSVSIWGVNGSPQVKDVYLPKGGWRTVLVAGLGRGGKSFFALDITDPSSPKHLFTVDNDSDNDKVHIWQGERDYTAYDYTAIRPEFDYRDLAQTWSTPRIVNIDQGSGQIPAIVLGSGFSLDPATSGHLYVVRLDQGSDGGSLLTPPVAIPRDPLTGWNSGVSAPLTVINYDVTRRATYTGSLVYFPTTDGRLFKFNLMGGTRQYELAQLFDAQSCLQTSGCRGRGYNGRFAFDGLTPAFGKDGVLRLFFGTGDVVNVNSVTTPPAENRIFAIEDPYFPGWKVNPPLVVEKKLGKVSQCQSEGNWKWPLPEANAKVTGRVALGRSSVMFTRYLPQSSGNSCSAGSAFFTELNFRCGKVVQDIDLGEGVATGVVIGKEKIYLGIGGQEKGPSTNKLVTKEADQLISIAPVSKRPDEGVKIEHWREKVH